MEDLLKDEQDTNWVLRRHSCSVEGIFDCLVRRFRKDVGIMNKELSSNGEDVFSVEIMNGGSKAIVRRVASTPFMNRFSAIQQVELQMRGENELIVRYGPSRFIITSEWIQETATCQLHIDGKPAELWQISQKALSDLFFDSEGS